MMRLFWAVVIIGALVVIFMEWRRYKKNSAELDKLKDEERELLREERVMQKKGMLRRKRASLEAEDRMGDIDDALSKINLNENREEK